MTGKLEDFAQNSSEQLQTESAMWTLVIGSTIWLIATIGTGLAEEESTALLEDYYYQPATASSHQQLAPTAPHAAPYRRQLDITLNPLAFLAQPGVAAAFFTAGAGVSRKVSGEGANGGNTF